MRKALLFFGWPILLIPTLVLHVGMLMNLTVSSANGHLMPVANPICATDKAGMVQSDYLHTCEVSTSKLKWLDDRFPVTGAGDVSLGDILQSDSENLIEPSRVIWFLAALVFFIRRFAPNRWRD